MVTSIGGKICGKIKHCWIGTKIGVVVDFDPTVMVVVCNTTCG